jgi:hypothetical protein
MLTLSNNINKSITMIMIQEKYIDGIIVIKKTLEGFYKLSDAEYFNLLDTILGPYNLINRNTYYVALHFRDELLKRPSKATLEYYKYLDKLIASHKNKK